MKINDEETELDMTLPLEKTQALPVHESTDEFDKTLIPQLDGESDYFLCVSITFNSLKYFFHILS